MDGWMIFMGDAPMIGLDPQPSGAPIVDNGMPTDAAGWADAYNLFTRFAEANQCVADDRDSLEDSDIETDDDDPLDFILRVRVHDDGSLEIFDDNATEPFTTYTAKDIFDAYGMPFPT